MYYTLLLLSALLFSIRFLFDKNFSKIAGDGMLSAMAKSTYESFVTVISMMAVSSFSVNINTFTVVMATLYTVVVFLTTLCSFKAFKYANLSVYSMFLMMGSVVLPSLCGILMYKEALTISMIISYICIIISLYLSVKSGNANKKAYLYYVLVFMGNGIGGVICKIYQASINATSTDSFLMLSALVRMIVCGIILICMIRKTGNDNTITDKKAVSYALIGGVIQAVANYINIWLVLKMPVSVHSVVTTGGVLVFSALVSTATKEKISIRNAISLVIAICAVILAII